MIDLSWSELIFIGLIAILLLNPEEVPGLFRQLGEYTQKIQRWFNQQTRPTWIFPTNTEIQPYISKKNELDHKKY